MKSRWEEKTRGAPWQEPVVDPIVDRLQTVLGAGNVAVLKGNQSGEPRCLVHVNTTTVAGRAMSIIRAFDAPVVPVLGRPETALTDLPAGAVLLNIGRMNALLSVDTESQVAHVQSGSRWRRVEYLLRRRGLTLGSMPAWLMNRTIGESIALNDQLRPSPLYGQLVDNTLAVIAVLPGGAITRSAVVPRRATGPDLPRLLLGTGHAAGLVTEVHLQTWVRPERWAHRALGFDSWAGALSGAARALGAGVRPMWWRVHRSQPDGPIQLWAAIAGTKDGLADAHAESLRFERVAAQAGGWAIDPGEAAAFEDAMFPEPSPDPRRREKTVEPFPVVAGAPRRQLPQVAALLDRPEIWEIGPTTGTVFAQGPTDEQIGRRLRALGAWLQPTRAEREVDAWAPTRQGVLDIVGALPPAPIRPEDLPKRYTRGGARE